MNKQIILTSGAQKYADVPEYSDFRVIGPAEIDGYFAESAIGEDSTYVLVFCCVDEYPVIQSSLEAHANGDAISAFVLFSGDGEHCVLPGGFPENISDLRTGPVSKAELRFIVERTFRFMETVSRGRKRAEEYRLGLEDTRRDQEDLINIGRALSNEKDPEKLLTLMLFLSKKITGADAGSIYLVEDNPEGGKRLRFKTSHTFSRELPLNEFVMPMDKNSIAGYVAVTGEVLNIPDVYRLSETGEFPFTHNSSIDVQHNYLTRSMLVVPMRNYQDEVIGVIQLINSKESGNSSREAEGNEAYGIMLITPDDFDRYVVAFDQKYNRILEAIAGQAAIAIENNRMIKQIELQFEQFVKASVKAIESRDPATSGHSFRVAEICKQMAFAVNSIHEGYLKDIYFTPTMIRELEFAALLHDFGKVYIDLAIFRKEKKLFPRDFENLMIRLDYLYRCVELQFAERIAGVPRDDREKINQLVDEKLSMLEKILEIKGRLIRLNEPAVTEEDPEVILDAVLSDMAGMECVTVEGSDMKVITDVDRLNLSIRRGSLNPEERREIETHVVHTYNFVKKIPWPSGYKNIPEITLRHHEKLNGKGYPDGLKGRDSTPVQARMMAIADIYDALASPDRPYKKAVPREKILDILWEEADKGYLDPDLVEIFISFRVYDRVDPDMFRQT